MLGDSNWASHVEHCASTRQIANYAIDHAAVELVPVLETRLRRDARLSMGLPQVEH
jgi:hypothetical protein